MAINHWQRDHSKINAIDNQAVLKAWEIVETQSKLILKCLNMDWHKVTLEWMSGEYWEMRKPKPTGGILYNVKGMLIEQTNREGWSYGWNFLDSSRKYS